MAELVTSHSRSLAVSTLDEHTDLDALLGAILADSASTCGSEPATGAEHYETRPMPSSASSRTVMATAVSTPRAASMDSMARVTVRVGERPATKVEPVIAPAPAARAPRAARSITMTPEDFELGIRSVELEPAAEERPEPRLDEIDKFLDGRIGRMTSPGWSTFAPEARSDDAGLFRGGMPATGPLTAATRRIAAVAAALGLGVLVVWTVLH